MSGDEDIRSLDDEGEESMGSTLRCSRSPPGGRGFNSSADPITALVDSPQSVDYGESTFSIEPVDEGEPRTSNSAELRVGGGPELFSCRRRSRYWGVSECKIHQPRLGNFRKVIESSRDGRRDSRYE